MNEQQQFDTLEDPPAPPKHATRDQAFRLYTEAGNSLTPKERGILAQAVKALLHEGTPKDVVLAAVRELGEAHEFPGFLYQRARDLRRKRFDGGTNIAVTCVNGEERNRLTREQLKRCPCADCLSWLKIRENDPLPFDTA